MRKRFHFQFYIIRGHDRFRIQLFANSEKLAKEKLEKLLMGKFETQLEKVEECYKD
jgi:hypothetical protein